MLAALHGQPCDQLPWSPRLDLWRLALQARGTLPARFAGRDLPGIARELGCACHMAQGSDATHDVARDLTLRGLGLEDHGNYPWRVELEGLPVRHEQDAEDLRTWIDTPAGSLYTHLHQDAEMQRRGISLPFVRAYALSAPDQLQALGIVFDHLRVVPTPERYAAFQARIGDQGVAVARGPVAASPLHLLLHELMPMDRFFYAYHDMPERLRELARHMDPVFEAILDACCACSAEVVMWGANFDRDLTVPRFFAGEMLPWLQRAAKRLHAAGKLMLCHTDGESTGLFELYRTSGMDVAESVCPAPMTERTLPEIREALGPHIAVWGGIPSVTLLDDAMDERTYLAYIEQLLTELGTGQRLVLGVADNVPPDANLERLEYLGRRIAAWGPVLPCRPVTG